jgi:hypothetical protein
MHMRIQVTTSGHYILGQFRHIVHNSQLMEAYT